MIYLIHNKNKNKTMETTQTNVAVSHQDIFNADFGLIASAAATVYSFVMIFGIQLIA